ncbi:hypothetical protein OF83DRAFT_119580 [Amylostereum chailletii]|nr:hypothetical protein OF83DRAFT_143831 [Amylostereum chailletii]KAI0309045.1 hypothetical protein OF83DRAFT_119580 [Amylostereum chailletii]
MCNEVVRYKYESMPLFNGVQRRCTRSSPSIHLPRRDFDQPGTRRRLSPMRQGPPKRRNRSR